MRLQLLLPILLISSFGPVFSQVRPKEAKAIVYVYALGAGSTMGKREPSVFVDEAEVAQVRPRRFFIALLEPGKHFIRLKKSKRTSGVALDLEAGQKYYVRLRWEVGSVVFAAGFDVVQRETAEYDLRELKPIDQYNIKDATVVTTKLM